MNCPNCVSALIHPEGDHAYCPECGYPYVWVMTQKEMEALLNLYDMTCETNALPDPRAAHFKYHDSKQLIRQVLVRWNNRSVTGGPDGEGVEAEDSTKRAYLVKINKGLYPAWHLWEGEDTACRMYSTGGMDKKNYNVVVTDEPGMVCGNCRAVDRRIHPQSSTEEQMAG